MVPEIDNQGATSTLGSIASSFGLDISDAQNADAITPMIYPDLMEDNGFVANLLSVQVISHDNRLKTTYFDYLLHYQKQPWWNKISNIFTRKDSLKVRQQFDPYHPNKKEDDILQIAKKNIKIDVDKKTGEVTVTASDQDPLICKTIAEAARSKLQVFITKYRTKKAKFDFEHYKKIAEESRASYETIRRQYGQFSDANTDVVLQSVKSKEEDIENEMQLKYNAYTAAVTQMEVYRAKLQAQTPSFTLIKGASVPIKPIKPKRMLFVLLWFIIAFIGVSIYVLRDIILPKSSSD
jgi:capsule polysaccharide export protein KpsE/RkpR